ncbi:hypothetical protein ACH5RR_016807 [Cinchona calisaya]|uniref:SGNH hydrolase-type esterase domain-containing protein n=1 Tax=Cinchona calisaya TaxID=153742 RepID=A0ABD2ZY78_9GENT
MAATKLLLAATAAGDGAGAALIMRSDEPETAPQAIYHAVRFVDTLAPVQLLNNTDRCLMEVYAFAVDQDAAIQPSLVILYFGGNDSMGPHSSGLGPHVPLPEYDGIHLSAEGSKMVVEEMLKVLKEAEWVPSLHWKSMPTEFAADSPYDLVDSDGKTTMNPSEWTFHREIQWD